MPMFVQHIDKIARDKNRDVLLISFKSACSEIDPFEDFDYESMPARREMMAWLTATNISFCYCMGVAQPGSIRPYVGDLYVDVPYDVNDRDYQKLAALLEYPDGTRKIDGVQFGYLPLSLALKNAHHDAPGFWEQVAQDW